MESKLLIEALLPLLDDIQNLFRIFLCKRKKREKSFPVFCQPHRNNGYALQERQIFGKVTDTSLQLLAVINALAENNLPVHQNPAFIKPVHLFQCFPRKTIVQHPAPKLGIRRMKRNVNRLQMVFDNPFHIMVTHVCQRNIISLQKGKSGVIILKIQGFSHALRHLVNKAEHTFISAGTVLIHQPLRKCKSQVFLIILFYLKLPFFPIRFLNEQCKLFVIYIEMIIKYVLYHIFIYRNQLVPGLYSKLRCNTSRFDCLYNMFLFHNFFLKIYHSFISY